MMQSNAVVYVVDDDAPMREALTNLAQCVRLRVLAFASAQEFLGIKRLDAPGCLVLDVRLPDLSGLDLQRLIIEADLEIPVVFITGYGDIPMSVRAMKAGAVDFLTKPFREQDLLDAIQQGLERDRKMRDRRMELENLSSRFESLTRRERDVMTLAVAGLLNKQIAAQLGMSETTVKTHRHQIMEKMEAGSFAELVRMSDRLEIPPQSRTHPRRR